MRFLLAFSILSAAAAFSQGPPDQQRKAQTDKIETILRIQDLRNPNNGSLIALLSDPNPIVRRHAYAAFGSIQDTTALQLLARGLNDPVTEVQDAAAFALGQTGTLLSQHGREELEHDLIWNRLPDTQVADRLIEEIGKFGTSDALQDLIVRYGSTLPRRFEEGLTMAVARFAIRGVVLPGAVQYLLETIKTSTKIPWQALYALQRIGDHPLSRQDVESLALLRNDRDPLVRMNLAQLFGKMRIPRVTREPLIRLATYDSDWRVRVAAFRSIATYDLAADTEALDLFRRAFYDANVHVALTALSALRASSLTAPDTARAAAELLSELRHISENNNYSFRWQYQAEACLTTATILRQEALRSVIKTSWPDLNLNADIQRAIGSTGSNEAEVLLFAGAHAKASIVQCGALDGLSSLLHLRPNDHDLRNRIRSLLPEISEEGDVAVVSTAAAMMADSLLIDTQTANDLLRVLEGLKGADDVEAVLEVVRSLGTVGDGRAAPRLVELLSNESRVVAEQAASALRRITGSDYSSRIAFRQPFFTDFDFAYLRTLPDTIRVTIATTLGDITAELYKDAAPFTIMSMLKISRERGFYRGLTFHRVVPNFVIQGGCPRGDGWGGPGFLLRSEFSIGRYETGTLGMASAGKDTEGSQFFITHSPQPHLDGKYTIIGRIIHGQEIVDSIQRGDRMFDFKALD
jgi:cyclophilin family peptidyl-prolyl cis-trans isomerase